MNHQTKFGLILGLGIILFCGILISDHLAARSQADIEAAAPRIANLGETNPTNQPLNLRDQLQPLQATVVERPAPEIVQTSGFSPVPQPTGPAANPQPVTVPGPGAAQRTVPVPVPPAITYTVKAGDDLGKIAAATLGSAARWPEIVNANAETLPNRERTVLRVGMELRVPSTGAAVRVPVAPNPAPADPAPTSRTYTVQKGDTLYGIALKLLGNGSRSKEIEKANPGLKSGNMKPGTVIKIPN